MSEDPTTPGLGDILKAMSQARPDLTPESLNGLRYEGIGNTLVITSPQCTCHPEVYGHEQYCGTDPVVIGLTEDPERLAQVVEECNWLLDQLRRALSETVHYVPEDGAFLHAVVNLDAIEEITNDKAQVTCQTCVSILRKRDTRDGL